MALGSAESLAYGINPERITLILLPASKHALAVEVKKASPVIQKPYLMVRSLNCQLR